MGAISEPTAGLGRYLEDDMYNFAICAVCAHWNPFLVSLDANPQVIKYRESFDIQLYCPLCAPRPAHFAEIFPGEKLFREESILNDRQLMDLLGKFNYKHPADVRFSQLDRIIITENAKLRQPYKVLAKKPLPLTRKLVLLLELFPPMHRLKNEKYRNFRAMCAAVRRKASEIADGYMNLSEAEHSQLQDNFDVLIDRTPMHVRMSSQQPQRLQMPPPPTMPGPSAAADDTLSSVGDISVASSATMIDALRTQASPGNSDINISSQEVGNDPGRPLISSQSQELASANVSEAQSTSNSDLQMSSQDLSGPAAAIPLSSQDTHVLPTVRPNSRDLARSDSSTSSSSAPLESNVSASRTLRKRSLNQDQDAAALGSGHDSSTSSSSASLESNVSASRTRRKRSLNQDQDAPALGSGPPTPNDGQVAGPSRKRPRNEPVMNPSPAQFMLNPHMQRKPRLLGA